MSHRADHTFFDEKLGWSQRKDRILGAYLVAYLPKIATQRRPILLVDGFAGAGKFSDNSDGSPLIMLRAVRKASTPRTSIMAIEADPVLFQRLSHVVQDLPEINPHQGRFLDYIDEIEIAARTSSVFLYLDPFAARGLDMSQLLRVFQWIKKGSSVEVLINFQVSIFARWALSAVKSRISPETDGDVPSTPEIEELDSIVGGNWWRVLATESVDFVNLTNRIVDGYCDTLRRSFNEVCFHPIFAKTTNSVPKYVLVFGSRHPDALELMNDEMVKSHRSLVESELNAEPQGHLFVQPKQLPPDIAAALREIVVNNLDSPMRRGLLIQRTIRSNFGQFLRKEIRGEIEKQLIGGSIRSETGKVRINDDVVISRVGSQ